MRPLRLPFDAVLTLPGSKSHANRALVAACLAPGRTTIRNATPCEDVERMVVNLQRLGFRIAWRDRPRGRVEIDGGLPQRAGRATLDCGNAGTTLRFLTSLCCLVPGNWRLTGTRRMQQRPIGPLVTALRELGAEIHGHDGCPPLHVRGGTLRGGRVALDASVSSQFLSSLLLVSPAVPEGIDVRCAGQPASVPYLELTRRVMAAFGVTRPGDRYAPCEDVLIEGDWSALGAFLVLAEITGSRVRGTNLDPASAQADRRLPGLIAAMRIDGDVTVDCGDTPDQLMNLAVLAAHRQGRTHFTGARNLRHKECDRLRIVRDELRKVGIAIEEHEDGVDVEGKAELRPATLDPHDDHRMAMAFAILKSVYDGVEILDPGCVAKSYPGFFEDLAGLHASPRCLALVGMRGAGKSTLGRTLARRLGLPAIDSDARFEEAHGAIGAFVERHGWPAFRRHEEQIVRDALGPGRVVALGGGAVRSTATAARLREQAHVVFLDEEPEELQRRLASGGRPSLTGLHPQAELPAVLAERQPIYRALADTRLPGSLTTERQAVTLCQELAARCSW